MKQTETETFRVLDDMKAQMAAYRHQLRAIDPIGKTHSVELNELMRSVHDDMLDIAHRLQTGHSILEHHEAIQNEDN